MVGSDLPIQETAYLILVELKAHELRPSPAGQPRKFIFLDLPVIRMKLSKRGSRNSDGNVPNINWNSYSDKLNVNNYNPDNFNDNIRARVEVSHKKELNNF